ncbi:MAG: imidazolonepropionase [Clostridia bacterium]|nr:imidazolonepropionase [Clostridia bacterium]
MSKIAYLNASQIVTMRGGARKGLAMNDIGILPKGNAIVTDGERICFVGQQEEALRISDSTVDCTDCVLMPAFIDSHTHLVFGGYRENEFNMRLNGADYMEIMQSGGGINATVRATRATSEAELSAKSRKLLCECMRYGVGTVEIKSGYGLDCDNEIKQLDVIESLRKTEDISIVSTFMGAHATPDEYGKNVDAYAEFLVECVLPRIASRCADNPRYAEFCDVFCEKGVFSHEQTIKILECGKQYGLKPKMHADEMMDMSSAALAAKLGCVSADHLLHTGAEGIEALSRSDTVATLLPLTAFSLCESFANARGMVDGGCCVALASDLNPGSCFSNSIPLLIALSTIYMKLTVNETLCALTANAAKALNLSDRGSLEVGKRADLLLLDCDNVNFLSYHFGNNFAKSLIIGGKKVY